MYKKTESNSQEHCVSVMLDSVKLEAGLLFGDFTKKQKSKNNKTYPSLTNLYPILHFGVACALSVSAKTEILPVFDF